MPQIKFRIPYNYSIHLRRPCLRKAQAEKGPSWQRPFLQERIRVTLFLKMVLDVVLAKFETCTFDNITKLIIPLTEQLKEITTTLHKTSRLDEVAMELSQIAQKKVLFL